MDVVTINRPKTPGDLILMEVNQHYTRERVTVLAGSGTDRVIPQFAVVAQVLIASLAVSAAKVGTGNGVITGATVAAGTKTGAFVATCIGLGANAGKFLFEDPDGIELGMITVGTPFTLGGITATIADGATDWAEGDQVTYTVTATAATKDTDGEFKWVQLDLTGTNGSQTAAGIAIHGKTATIGNDEKTDIVRRGPTIVRKDQLVWPAGANATQIAAGLAQLQALGILARVSG